MSNLNKLAPSIIKGDHLRHTSRLFTKLFTKLLMLLQVVHKTKPSMVSIEINCQLLINTNLWFRNKHTKWISLLRIFPLEKLFFFSSDSMSPDNNHALSSHFAVGYQSLYYHFFFIFQFPNLHWSCDWCFKCRNDTCGRKKSICGCGCGSSCI